jgi:hypothetical protein
MIIRLLLGIYKKARKPSIYLCIEGVKALARRRRWTIAFRYVPRQLNAVPDDMCRRAEAAGEEVRYDLGDVPAGAPALDLPELYRVVDGLAEGARHVCAVLGPIARESGGSPEAEPWDDRGVGAVLAAWDERLRGVACGKCGQLDREAEMAVCDRCEVPFHRECQPRNLPGDGPWYCGQCRGRIRLDGTSDPVEDLALLDYLFRGRLPDDDDAVARLRRLALRYRARGQELEALVNPYGVEALQRWVPVPPIPMRAGIIRDTHEATGHVGRERLVEALLAAYWWPGLRSQVGAEVARCPTC